MSCTSSECRGRWCYIPDAKDGDIAHTFWIVKGGGSVFLWMPRVGMLHTQSGWEGGMLHTTPPVNMQWPWQCDQRGGGVVVQHTFSPWTPCTTSKNEGRWWCNTYIARRSSGAMFVQCKQVIKNGHSTSNDDTLMPIQGEVAANATHITSHWWPHHTQLPASRGGGVWEKDFSPFFALPDFFSLQSWQQQCLLWRLALCQKSVDCFYLFFISLYFQNSYEFNLDYLVFGNLSGTVLNQLQYFQDHWIYEKSFWIDLI